jgi:hypothetical protein
MPHDPKRFVVTDPRTFDGNPFEVANRAIAQISALVKIAAEAAADAEVMALNASMERDCQADKEPDAVGWPESPQGRRWAEIQTSLVEISKTLVFLGLAASYDPRHPPTA